MEVSKRNQGNKRTLNTRIRDIKRLLEKRGHLIPEDVKLQKEQELEGLLTEKLVKKRVEAEKDFVRKYRRIKFFEKQKLVRKRRQLMDEILELNGNVSEDALEERKKREDELRLTKENLLYIMFYPNFERYISLFSKKTTSNARAMKRQRQIKRKILKAYGNQLDELTDPVNGKVFLSDPLSSKRKKERGGETSLSKRKRTEQSNDVGEIDDVEHSNNENDAEDDSINNYLPTRGYVKIRKPTQERKVRGSSIHQEKRRKLHSRSGDNEMQNIQTKQERRFEEYKKKQQKEFRAEWNPIQPHRGHDIDHQNKTERTGVSDDNFFI